MTRGGMVALDVMSVFSVVADALTRRALDLAVAQSGESPTRFSWLALGSQARREALPSSDLDSAIAWLDDGDEARRSARTSTRSPPRRPRRCSRCGFRPDEHRVSAADPLFVRSLSSWERESRSLIDDPTQKKALVIVSVLVDSRPVWGVETEPLIAEVFQRRARRVRSCSVSSPVRPARTGPPTGFLRGLVVESSGEHRARLDLKKRCGGADHRPGRWAGLWRASAARRRRRG